MGWHLFSHLGASMWHLVYHCEPPGPLSHLTCDYERMNVNFIESCSLVLGIWSRESQQISNHFLKLAIDIVIYIYIQFNFKIDRKLELLPINFVGWPQTLGLLQVEGDLDPKKSLPVDMCTRYMD